MWQRHDLLSKHDRLLRLEKTHWEQTIELNNEQIRLLERFSSEFCGRPGHHPYEQFLQLEGIEHRTIKVRWPQSNVFIERLHRTLLDEHFRIKGRTIWYESVGQMQTDLDSYLEDCNNQRPHQGRMMEGQTSYSMFKKGLKLIPKEVRTKVA